MLEPSRVRAGYVGTVVRVGDDNVCNVPLVAFKPSLYVLCRVVSVMGVVVHTPIYTEPKKSRFFSVVLFYSRQYIKC